MSPQLLVHRLRFLLSSLLILNWIGLSALGRPPSATASTGTPPPPTEAPLSSEDGAAAEPGTGLPHQPTTPPPTSGSQEDARPPFDSLPPERAEQRAQHDHLAAALRDFDAARSAGPEAVLAFAAVADPEVQAAIQPTVDEARATLAPATGPALAGGGNIAGIDGSCAYATVQAAINAASNGATVRVVGQVITESIDLAGKVITLTGGYDATCDNPVGASQTTLQAAAAGSVVDLSGGSQVILNNLIIRGGSGFGAGMDVLGSSHATLNNADVQFNAGGNGGGFYIGGGSAVTLTNGSRVYSNTATSGGGAIVYGRLNALDTASDFSTNAATDGGNLYVAGGTLYLDNADVVAGTAADRGGGIFASGGAVITLTNSVFVGESAPCCQSATDGGGIYADASQVYLLGPTTSVLRNTATNNGGGVYLANGSYLFSDGSNIGNASVASNDNTAVLGGGLYVVSSTVDFSGRIFNNTATNSGGGLYATASVILLTNATVGGTDVNDPNVIGATGLNGAGLYLINNTQATLINTVVTSNTLTNLATGYGGGIYIRAGSVLTATNSRIERHLAPSAFDGRGAGLYIYDATVTLSNTQVLSNTAANKGGGARMFGASTLNVLAGSVFRNNHALDASVGEGGAIAANNAPEINIFGATFLSNTANGNGGAIYTNASLLTINSTYFHRNTAVRGGALYQEGSGAAAWITNTLVYSNTSLLGFGAGIRNAAGAMTITHGTFAHNIGGAGYSPGSAQSFVYNTIIWGNSEAAFGALTAASCNIDQGGTAGPATNPLFSEPGAGENYRLQEGSPARDACASGAAVDLDNRPRPYGALFDMGAYEYNIRFIFLPVILR